MRMSTFILLICILAEYDAKSNATQSSLPISNPTKRPIPSRPTIQPIRYRKYYPTALPKSPTGSSATPSRPTLRPKRYRKHFPSKQPVQKPYVPVSYTQSSIPVNYATVNNKAICAIVSNTDIRDYYVGSNEWICSVSGVPASSVCNWLGITCNADGILTALSIGCDFGQCYAGGLSGTIPTEIGYATGLTLLDMSQNNLTSTIPTTIKYLKNLIVLDLNSNMLSGRIPHAVLSSVTRLTYLDLSSNFFNSTLPVDVARLTSLVNLNLASNVLTGSIPSSLCDLPALKLLNISPRLQYRHGQAPPCYSPCLISSPTVRSHLTTFRYGNALVCGS